MNYFSFPNRLVTVRKSLPTVFFSLVPHSRDTTGLRTVSYALLLAMLTCTASAAGADSKLNQMCPVMPESPVEHQWTTVYKGKTVLFCCNNCVDAFRRNPSRYTDKLPQFTNGDSDKVSVSSGLKSAFSRITNNQKDWTAVRRGSNCHALLTVFLTGLILFAIWRITKRILASKEAHSQLTIRPMYAELCVSLLVALVIQLALTKQRLEGEVLESDVLRVVHHATYYDHGYPPVPPKPDLAPRLSATFYRGNDERSGFLFNGGNYLTAQFDLWIERSDGTRVEYQDDISGQSVFLVLAIRRPPHSPERLYGSRIMERIYLTKECSPLMGWRSAVKDLVTLDSVGDDRRDWRARYGLGVLAGNARRRIDPKTVTRSQLSAIEGVNDQIATWFLAYRDAGYPIRGTNDLRQAGIEGMPQRNIATALGEIRQDAIVYVCEANHVGKHQIGARFHYGIQYELVLRDGIVLPESNVWMGALSRSQKAARGAIPDDQWLGTDPLPTLPDEQDLSDELLGLDDYPDL